MTKLPAVFEHMVKTKQNICIGMYKENTNNMKTTF